GRRALLGGRRRRLARSRGRRRRLAGFTPTGTRHRDRPGHVGVHVAVVEVLARLRCRELVGRSDRAGQRILLVERLRPRLVDGEVDVVRDRVLVLKSTVTAVPASKCRCFCWKAMFLATTFWRGGPALRS